MKREKILLNALKIYADRENWRWCGEHFYGNGKQSHGAEFAEKAIKKFNANRQKGRSKNGNKCK